MGRMVNINNSYIYLWYSNNTTEITFTLQASLQSIIISIEVLGLGTQFIYSAQTQTELGDLRISLYSIGFPLVLRQVFYGSEKSLHFWFELNEEIQSGLLHDITLDGFAALGQMWADYKQKNPPSCLPPGDKIIR